MSGRRGRSVIEYEVGVLQEYRASPMRKPFKSPRFRSAGGVLSRGFVNPEPQAPFPMGLRSACASPAVRGWRVSAASGLRRSNSMRAAMNIVCGSPHHGDRSDLVVGACAMAVASAIDHVNFEDLRQVSPSRPRRSFARRRPGCPGFRRRTPRGPNPQFERIDADAGAEPRPRLDARGARRSRSRAPLAATHTAPPPRSRTQEIAAEERSTSTNAAGSFLTDQERCHPSHRAA